MQQRKLIEIAKCLNKDPEIFIVDETTTALSETGRNLLYKKMEELKNAGRSVLFISHDLDELMEKCDTLTVLRDGNIVANLDKAKGEFDAAAAMAGFDTAVATTVTLTYVTNYNVDVVRPGEEGSGAQGQLSTPSAQRQPPQVGWVLPMQSSLFSANSSQWPQ